MAFRAAVNVRFARPEDSAALLAIYAQYIEKPVTFEYDLPSEAAFAARIRDISQVYPYLVCEEKERIVGYAYAHRAWARAAYQWGAELSVYLDRDCTSRGVGRRLYGALIALLRLQGVRTAYGCVTLPNEKSERLHLGMGFVMNGVFHKAGYKCGQWHDVGWFEKALAPYEADPAPLRSIHEADAEAVAQILKAF